MHENAAGRSDPVSALGAARFLRGGLRPYTTGLYIHQQVAPGVAL